ncbi:MAG TPA: hypothetical protein VHK91_17725 [Flavisolibacter sp.]|jgi:hypothetical protein|nr:hypothetical protein [Flavisolibacter sp.]
MAQVLMWQATQSMQAINRCRYALLKYLELYNLQPPAAVSVIVYTDRPAWLESFAPHFHQFAIKEVSETQLNEWKGPYGYAGRLRWEMLREYYTYADGAILFMEAASYPLQPVEPVFAALDRNEVFFLKADPLVETTSSEHRKWHRFLTTASLSYKGSPLVMSPGLSFYHTAAIGLPQQAHQLVEDVLSLTDTLYEQLPDHKADQLASGYCLKDHAVSLSGGLLCHYENFPEFDGLLDLFFHRYAEESIPNLVKLIHRLDAAALHREKQQFEALPAYKKWLRRLTGKAWNPNAYKKKI